MTATVPDVDTIEHLDFQPPVLCQVDDCERDKITAQPAIAYLVLDMPCCTRKAPICEKHLRVHLPAMLIHRPVVCEVHPGNLRCAHRAMSFEPLS